jgi:hypothetical protein
MEIPDYPPNSDASKRSPLDDKKVERVTSGEAKRKKKSLGKQFKETFVGGDARTASRYVVMDVLIPAARDMIVDAGVAGIEKLIFGESRRRRGSTPPPSGPSGYFSYNRQYAPPPQSRTTGPDRAMSRRARAAHDFDEIILESRGEAEEVINRLFEIVSRYESATVADLYELVGLASVHTDHKWGWTNIRGAGVSRVRDGYLLDLPEPQPLGA